MHKLTHMDDDNKPRMVDVSRKPPVLRIARASGAIKIQPQTARLIEESKIRKGNVLITAELAGIQAAKKTSDFIPLCHTITLSQAVVKAVLKEKSVSVTSEVTCIGQTGVEMEALTAVSVALLTIYDMCKAVDKNMVLSNITLIDKQKIELTETD